MRGESVERGHGEVEARVGLPVLGRLAGRGDLGVRAARAGRSRTSSSSRDAASAGRAGLDDPAEVQRVQPVRRRRSAVIRAAARADGVPGLSVTTVPPPRPRVVSTSPACAQGGHRLAQGGAGDLEPLGEVALGRQRGAARVDARAGSRSPSCSTHASKAWWPRTGRSTASGRWWSPGWRSRRSSSVPGHVAVNRLGVNGLSSYHFYTRLFTPRTARV